MFKFFTWANFNRDRLSSILITAIRSALSLTTCALARSISSSGTDRTLWTSGALCAVATIFSIQSVQPIAPIASGFTLITSGASGAFHNIHQRGSVWIKLNRWDRRPGRSRRARGSMWWAVGSGWSRRMVMVVVLLFLCIATLGAQTVPSTPVLFLFSLSTV